MEEHKVRRGRVEGSHRIQLDVHKDRGIHMEEGGSTKEEDSIPFQA